AAPITTSTCGCCYVYDTSCVSGDPCDYDNNCVVSCATYCLNTANGASCIGRNCLPCINNPGSYCCC
ncbi:unnamed protein product, partial [Rotaria sp. Silwood1]